jgi:hypothetical protein
MADRDLDAVFYVKTIPEIVFKDEHFHVCFKIGRANFEFVLRPEIYIKAHMLGDGEVAKWQHHTSSDNVSRMPPKK